MLANAKVLAGSGWLGLKDREAYVTRGVKLTPMFTGFTALSALLLADRARLVARGPLTAAIHVELLIPCGRPVCSPAQLA